MFLPKTSEIANILPAQFEVSLGWAEHDQAVFLSIQPIDFEAMHQQRKRPAIRMWKLHILLHSWKDIFGHIYWDMPTSILLWQRPPQWVQQSNAGFLPSLKHMCELSSFLCAWLANTNGSKLSWHCCWFTIDIYLELLHGSEVVIPWKTVSRFKVFPSKQWSLIDDWIIQEFWKFRELVILHTYSLQMNGFLSSVWI